MEHAHAFGFILTRCVQLPLHDAYWKEAVRCIRGLFPSAPIVIIDDHSDTSLVHTDDDVERDSMTTVVPSHLPKGAGEFIPYHYLYAHHPFQKAVIMHDSMFLQDREPLASMLADERLEFKFLWYFNRCQMHMLGCQHKLMETFHQRQPLLELQSGGQWWGCFGACTLITLAYLTKLHDEYGFMNMANSITARNMRMAFERVLALCCIHASSSPISIDTLSVYGNIDHHYRAFRYPYHQYLRDKKQGQITSPCIKIWSRR